MEDQNPIHTYFDAFCRRDLKTIDKLLAQDVTLQDPYVGRVLGKEAVLDVYRTIFLSSESIQIVIHKIHDAKPRSVAAEFYLRIKSKDGSISELEGVDCIELEGGQIHALRAYIDTPRG